MYEETSKPLVRRTRHTLRSAELGFFGVVVYTRVHTPRRWGQPCSAGTSLFSTGRLRGLRTSWLIVAITKLQNKSLLHDLQKAEINAASPAKMLLQITPKLGSAKCNDAPPRRQHAHALSFSASVNAASTSEAEAPAWRLASISRRRLRSAWYARPVPAGIKRPTTTFSFKPRR